jgi:hypothetical protein
MNQHPSFASLVCAFFSCSFLACESHTPAAPTTPSPFAPSPATAKPVNAPPIARVEDAHGCPMDLPGARASVVELDDGVALDLTTPGDVMELRRRVRAIEDLALTDLEHGVRVTIAAGDPARRHALASRATGAAGELNRGDCTVLSASWLRAPGAPVEASVPPR